MSQKAREYLKNRFSDGQRPSGGDFGELIDSFVNQQTDNLSFDADGNLLLTRGVRLGDSAGTTAGGLRFNSNQLQVFTGGAWVNVSGGGGGGEFQAAPSTPQSAVVRDSNVGIGNFPATPTFKLEVQLASSGAPADQVRFGNVVCANGTGVTAAAAVVSHQNHASATNFALRQAVSGAVQVNAAAGQILSLTQGGGSAKIAISAAGNVIVGGQTELPGAPATANFQVNGDVFKAPSNTWGASDARVKEDVRDLDLGLSALCQVRPVRFRYNGRAGTPAGRNDVGIIGQEIERIVPETVQRVSVADDPGLDDMRIFDPAALTYVLINAVKELAVKVEQLEQALAVAKA